nr:MAG TPA: hypothetical protein [Caudoviricetes sp.]
MIQLLFLPICNPSLGLQIRENGFTIWYRHHNFRQKHTENPVDTPLFRKKALPTPVDSPFFRKKALKTQSAAYFCKKLPCRLKTTKNNH